MAACGWNCDLFVRRPKRARGPPHVTYDYTANDSKFSSHRISFDLFDKDGGKGHAETIVTRYPVGTKIDVYVDPTNPVIAILEPEVYSPSYAPLLFASLFVVLGGWFAVSGVMTAITPAMEEPGTEKKDFKPLAALGMSILFYAILVSVLLEDKAQETTQKAFGKVVFGLPSTMGVILAITVLYLPMPYVFWHALQISFQAYEDKKPLGLEYLKDIRHEHPHLVRSTYVSLMGLLYFVTVCVIWIVYAAKVGV